MFGEITAAFSAGKMAMESAKAVMRLAGEYDKIDLKLKAVELAQQVTELAQENIELRQECEMLRQNARIKDELIPRNNAYVRKLSDGREDGPFCTRCFDVKGILVRHIKYAVGLDCPNCIIERYKYS